VARMVEDAGIFWFMTAPSGPLNPNTVPFGHCLPVICILALSSKVDCKQG
jgi:hypothetical protein